MDDIILSALARGKPVSAARVRALVEENAQLKAELEAARAERDEAKEDQERMYGVYLVHQTILPNGNLGMDARTILAENIVLQKRIEDMGKRRMGDDRP